MKRAGNKTLKIIAATAVASFSLVAAVVSTVAWFIMANKVKGTDINVVIDDPSDSVAEITFHKYRGLSTDSYYLFNPDPEATLRIENKQIILDAPADFNGITLDTYSANDRHHPLLMLFKLKKGGLSLYARTEHPFLAEFKPSSYTTVASYGALTHVTTTNFVGGETYYVTSDEHNGGMDGSTYGATAYRWNADAKKWDMIWGDLGASKNPLSSVMETYFFMFSFASPSEGANTSHTLNGSNPNSIPIAKNDCTETNQRSFVQFVNGSFSHFSKTITFFEGQVPEDTVYLGIMVDYYSLALEYVSSYYLGDDRVSAGLNFTCDWLIGL